jgi:hypothetical protein
MRVPTTAACAAIKRNRTAHTEIARTRTPVAAAPVAAPAVAMTILFTDRGQDFTEWDVDADGVVIDSRPFQAWMWCKYRVVNEDLRPGDHVQIQPLEAPLRHPTTISYPVRQIRKEAGH